MAPNKESADLISGSAGSKDTALADESDAEAQIPLTRREEGREPKEEDEARAEPVVLTKALLEDILGSPRDTLCGLGSCRGSGLQRLAHPATYLVISSVVALVQGMFFTYSNATLSTIEKRFKLPSKVTGFVSTGNDVIQLVLSIHITYLAGHGHRPRWLALGMFCATLGCVLAVLPHFIFADPYNQTPGTTTLPNSTNKGDMLCVKGERSDSSTECGTESNVGAEQTTVVTLHLMAQMMAGFASMLYYTVGYSYLDEAVSKKRVPLFLAVSGSLRILGPVCGYSLASWALSYWVYPGNAPAIPPRHPSWVGAWWIGYLVIGSTLVVITWSLLLMPRTLPGARQRALAKLRAAADQGNKALQSVVKTLRPNKKKEGFRGIWPSVKRILTNKIYILIIINQMLFWFAFFGYITFKPKYLEHQFKMSAAKANQYIAGAAMAATLVGWLGTGTALTLFRPRAKWVLAFMAALSLTNLALHLCMVNVSCEHDTIHGMDQAMAENPDVPYKAQVYNTSQSESCVEGCGCSLRFSPVCVAGQNYYSPCVAGCTARARLNGTTVYQNCSCAEQSVSYETAQAAGSGEGGDAWGVARDGYCSHDCPAFYMYLALTVLTKMTHAASRIPVNLMLFRCVEERDKDVGLGVFNAAIALGSSIPAPIIFGWAIDYACRLWESSCGQQGFCWLYDLNQFRYILHGIPAAMMAGCLLTELFLLAQHHQIHFYGEEEEGETKLEINQDPGDDGKATND